MKKKLWAGLLAALIMAVSATTVLARGPRCASWPGRDNAGGACAYFTDENGDGVCDYFGSGAYGCGRRAGRQRGLNRDEWQSVPRGMWHLTEEGSWAPCADTDGSGVCDTCGAALPARNGFTDADNDGICDYFGSASCGGGYCGGRGGCRR